MSRLTSQQKLILTLVMGLVILFILAFYVVKPLISGLSQLHTAAEEANNAYHQLVLEETAYRTARADFAKIQNKADEIAALFPIREQLVRHIERLEAAATRFEHEFSLAISDVEPEEGQEQGKKEEPPYEIVPGLVGIQVIPYDFYLSGSFLGTIRFLQMLEHQPFYSEIETLVINGVFTAVEGGSVERRARSGQVEARIRAAFYARE